MTDQEIEYIKTKNFDFLWEYLWLDNFYSKSSDKIRRLGWKPKDRLFQDLPEIINWYKKNFNLYKKFKF